MNWSMSTSPSEERARERGRQMRRGSRFLYLCCCLALVVLFSSPVAISEAERAAMSKDKEEAAVHIVYTERPEGVEPEAYHIRTLASVVGSEEAAREALIYSYRTAANGFSAKLTPQQVAEISQQPGVLQVVPSRTIQLHAGPTKLH